MAKKIILWTVAVLAGTFVGVYVAMIVQEIIEYVQNADESSFYAKYPQIDPNHRST